MLGLTVTMMCGTQITAFAADAEEVAPVSIETEAKAETIEVKEEVADKVAEPKLSVTSNIATFDGTQDIVLTFKVDGLEGDFTWNTDVFSIAGSVVGSIQEQISKNEYRVTLRKDHLLNNVKKQNYKNGQTIEINAGGWSIEYDDENGERIYFEFPSTFVTYSDGTVTPEPEKPQPEPEKPQPDGGNGGTETPDPEKDGWIKTEEGWKYYENGQKATGWKAVSENWYYFNEDGIMATGWVSVGGHWYYLNSSGAMETGWTSVGSHWYYLNADGTMATGWVSIGGHWYYLNADGSMATGWVSIGGHWYYLNADGSMATGWASVGGHWYYLNTDGSMATGWVSVGGHWYYLNTDGSMASSQWIDGWYVDASGKML